MAEASAKIAKSIENITPHNQDLRPQFQDVKVYNLRKSLLTGYEGFSRSFVRPLSFRVYGSRGEIVFVALLSLYGLHSLKTYVHFQKEITQGTKSRHQYSMIQSSVDRSSLDDLGNRVPDELLHLWK